MALSYTPKMAAVMEAETVVVAAETAAMALVVTEAQVMALAAMAAATQVLEAAAAVAAVTQVVVIQAAAEEWVEVETRAVRLLRHLLLQRARQAQLERIQTVLSQLLCALQAPRVHIQIV